MTVLTTPQPAVIEAAAVSGRTLTAAKPGDPEPYIFGQVLAEGKLIAADDSAQYLVMDLLWSVGECEEVVYLVVNGINEGLGTQLGNNQHFTGAAGQIASTVMAAAKGVTYDTLAGKCHSVLSWLPGYNLDIKAMVKGLKLFDPRPSPQVTAYSTNPALAAAKLMGDCGYTINWASIGTSATYCDELIGSPQAKRWEIGLQITDRQPLDVWAHTIAQYCGCFMYIEAGEVFLVPDEPRAANHTVTKFVDGSVRLTKLGSKSIPSRVSVGYRELTGPADAVTEGAAYVEDKTASTSDYTTPGVNTVIQLPGIQSYTMARRKAQEIYNKAQTGDLLEFDSFDDGIERTIGDIGTITNAQYNLSAVDMTLIQNKQKDRGRWSRKYQEYNSGNYSDASYIEPTANTTTLDNPDSPPAGPTPTLYQVFFVDENDTEWRAIEVQFTGIEWAYNAGYLITATGADGFIVLDREIGHNGVVLHTTLSNEANANILYTVKVYIKSNTGAYSAVPGTATITTSLGVGLDWFTNADESDPFVVSPQLTNWDLPVDITSNEGTAAEYVIQQGDPPNTPYLIVDTPLSGPEVPIDATIDSIRIDVKAALYNKPTTSNVVIQNLQIENGSIQSSIEVTADDFGSGAPANYTFSGDLTYWGLSNAQALAFAAGTAWLQFRFYSSVDLTVTIDCYSVKASFSYTPA